MSECIKHFNLASVGLLNTVRNSVRIVVDNAGAITVANSVIVSTPRLSFGIIKNTRDNTSSFQIAPGAGTPGINNYASVCVKSNLLNENIKIFCSYNAWYGTAIQTTTLPPSGQGSSFLLTDAWTVLDNDSGYANGGGYMGIVMEEGNPQYTYEFQAMIKNVGKPDSADEGYLAVMYRDPVSM